MLNLIWQLIGLLADFIIGWLIPLVVGATLMPVLSILIAANPVLGGVVTSGILILLAYHHIHHRMWWQLIVIGGIFLPLITLVIFTPQWAILWTFFVQSIALVLLLIIPGAIIPAARRIIISWLVIGAVITLVLSVVIITGGRVFPTILGLIALGCGTVLLSRAARPWEIRRTQRRAGNLLTALGIALVFLGLLYNWRPKIVVPEPPQVFKDTWVVISAPIHRRAVTEEQKTKALEGLSSELISSHRQRWETGIKQIPTLPLSGEEWNELGVPREVDP